MCAIFALRTNRKAGPKVLFTFLGAAIATALLPLVAAIGADVVTHLYSRRRKQKEGSSQDQRKRSRYGTFVASSFFGLLAIAVVFIGRADPNYDSSRSTYEAFELICVLVGLATLVYGIVKSPNRLN